jgi:hypothetical protein
MQVKSAQRGTNLERVAQSVVHRAVNQGHVVQSDVRAELLAAGLPAKHWKQVIELAHPSLFYQRGRYHYVSPAVSRLRARVRLKQHKDRQIQRAVRQLVRVHRDAQRPDDRRRHERIRFIHPVRVTTDDNVEMRFLTKDICARGMCLLGNRSLKGQKVQVLVPYPGSTNGHHWCFTLHILWSAAICDGIYHQGGVFLEVINVA